MMLRLTALPAQDCISLVEWEACPQLPFTWALTVTNSSSCCKLLHTCNPFQPVCGLNILCSVLGAEVISSAMHVELAIIGMHGTTSHG
jgi:hypothetical protein